MTWLRPLAFLPPALLLSCVLLGCGGASESGGEWTVDEEALTLEEDFRVGDDEAFYFGSINDVAVRSDGRVYVADGEATHVKVLGAAGALQDSIGGPGNGPGEFKSINEIFLGRGDSLFVVHDGYVARLSAFGPSREFAYRTSFPTGSGRLPARPSEITPLPGDSGYLASYGSAPLSGQDLERRTVRRVNLARGAGDTLFTYPPAQMHIEQRNRGVTIRSIPFARGPSVTGDANGHFHYVWSDSLGVRMYGPGGDLLGTIDIPFEPVPVTEADRERALEGRSEESRAAVKNKIPDTKPAFEQFLIDDEGLYWFGRPTADPDSTDWWVAWPEEKRVATTRLSDDINFMTVRNGYAYGEMTTEVGAPVLVRYRVDLDS